MHILLLALLFTVHCINLQEMVKKEEEALRAAARKIAQQRKTKERARDVGLTSGFIEGEDSGGNTIWWTCSCPATFHYLKSPHTKLFREPFEVCVILPLSDEDRPAAIKAQFKNASRDLHRYYSDDSEEEEHNKRVLRDAKIIDSDDSADEATSSHQRQRRKHRIVEDEDED